MKRVREIQLGVAACLLFLGLTRPAGALQPGDILNETNWKEAEGRMPPELLEHYQKGEFANLVLDWPEGAVKSDEEFAAATRANAEKLTVNELGSIVDKATGKQPAFVYGIPFPKIDPQDPGAAVRVLWNHYYGFWSQGNNRTLTILNFVNPQAVDREVSQDVYFYYYDAQPSWRRPLSNPKNLLSQMLATTASPADLYGTTALSWRYRDAGQRDSVWAYVPALRRVRQVSPTNRSDGFLGSDLSQDDGPFFDGKPEDFTWKLVGETEVYRYVDPYSMRGEVKARPLPDGGWRMEYNPVPMVGYLQPGWKGLAWAPVSMALAKRKTWVIEGVPKDRYYLAGKIQLYIDKENYQGAFNRKFNWQGELVNVYGVNGIFTRSPDGKNYFRMYATTWQGAENLKMGRATIAGSPPPGWKDPPADYCISLEPDFFNYQSLLRFGK